MAGPVLWLHATETNVIDAVRAGATTRHRIPEYAVGIDGPEGAVYLFGTEDALLALAERLTRAARAASNNPAAEGYCPMCDREDDPDATN